MKTLPFFILGTALATFGANSTGLVYELGAKKETPLFHWYRKEEASGNEQKILSVFENIDKTEAVHETTLIREGKLVHHTLLQKQLEETGEVEVRDGKIFFSYTRQGKTEVSEEGWQDNFVLAPTLIDYLRPRKEELLKGESIKVRFGVLERRETVGFKLFLIEEKKIQNLDVLVVKMKPSSILIAAIVNPLLFTLRKSDLIPIMIEGRTFPKRNVEGKWKDLDAEVIYDGYPSGEKGTSSPKTP